LAGVVRLEQLVVHRPELALALRRDGRLGGVGRVRVHRQRVLLEDEADVLAVVLLDLVEGIDHPPAEGALEVRPFDDGDLGVGRTLLRSVAEGDLVDLVRAGGRGRRCGRRRLRRIAQRRPQGPALGPHLLADGEAGDGADANRDEHVPVALHVDKPLRSLPDGRRAQTNMGTIHASGNFPYKALRKTTWEARASALWTSRSAAGASVQVATSRSRVPRSSMRTK